MPDLLIAATAELAGLVVLHLDEDFDLIADATGQAVERLALGGSHALPRPEAIPAQSGPTKS